MAQRGRGCDGLGGIGGEQQSPERRLVISCPVEMNGQLAGSIGTGEQVWWLFGQGVGDAAVKPLALRREKLVVDDLADQRMTKAVGVGVAIDDDELRVDRRVERDFERVRIHSGDPHQQVVARVVAHDGDHADDRSADDIETFELGGDEIGQHGGDRLPTEVGGDELCREERVPLTASEDLIDEVGGRHPSDQGLDLRGELIAAESSELHAARRGQACDLAEAATLLWVGSDLVGAVGANHHDVFVHEIAGEKIEQVPRQGVGPVQILEPDHDGPVRTDVGDELEQRREQRASRRPLGRRAAPDPVAQRRQGGLRKRSRMCSPNVAEQFGQWCQRDQLAAHW